MTKKKVTKKEIDLIPDKALAEFKKKLKVDSIIVLARNEDRGTAVNTAGLNNGNTIPYLHALHKTREMMEQKLMSNFIGFSNK